MDVLPVGDRMMFWAQKKPEELNVVAAFSSRIQEQYGAAAASCVVPHLQELGHLRPLLRQKDAAGPQTIRNQLRYCELLTQLSLHLPLADGDVAVEFTWHDRYSRKKASSRMLGFEVCCALFNAAVVHGGLACTARCAEEDLRLAGDRLQRCVTLLQYVQQRLRQEGVLSRTADMSPVGLTAVAYYAAAQALHTHYLRRSLATGDPAVLAQMAADVAHEYSKVLTQLAHPVLSPLHKHKDFAALCDQARLYCVLFEARSDLHAAHQRQVAGRCGEAVGHLLRALEQLQSKARALARDLARLLAPQLVQLLEGKVQQALEVAQRLNAAACQPVPRPEAMQTPPRSGFQLPAVAVPELQFAHRGDAFSALPRLPALERAVAQYRQSVEVATARAHESFAAAAIKAEAWARELAMVADTVGGTGSPQSVPPHLLSRLAAIRQQAEPERCLAFLEGLADSVLPRLQGSPLPALASRLQAVRQQLRDARDVLALLDDGSPTRSHARPFDPGEVERLLAVLLAECQAGTEKLLLVGTHLHAQEVLSRFAGTPSGGYLEVFTQLETEMSEMLARPEKALQEQAGHITHRIEELIGLGSARQDAQELTVQRWAAAVETYEALLMELQELHALAGPPAGVSRTPSTPVTGRRRERVSGTPGSPAVSQHSRPDPGSDDREKGVSRYSSHRLRGARPTSARAASSHSARPSGFAAGAARGPPAHPPGAPPPPANPLEAAAVSPSPAPSSDGLSDTDAENEKLGGGRQLEDAATLAALSESTSTQERSLASVVFSDISAATVYMERLPSSQPDLLDIPDEQMQEVAKLEYDIRDHLWHTSSMRCHVSATSFAEGNLRLCYRMVGCETPGERQLYVAKCSHDPMESEATYRADVETQELCRLFAESYNEFLPPKPVQFLRAFLIKMAGPTGRPTGVHQVYHVEPYLPGEYVKFNNNWGYVEEDENDRNTPQAFSHFTYVLSGGQYLVVDIQGVGDVYTDPQIHSADGQGFGLGNHGQQGIDEFFKSHQCNPLCRYLGLPLHQPKARDAGTRAAQIISPILTRTPSVGSPVYSVFSTPEKLIGLSMTPNRSFLIGSPAPSPGDPSALRDGDPGAEAAATPRAGPYLQAILNAYVGQQRGDAATASFATPPRPEGPGGRARDAVPGGGGGGEADSVEGVAAHVSTSSGKPGSALSEWQRLGISRAQYDVAAAVFAQLDPEGSGRIAKQLLLPSLRRLRLHVSLQQARDVMRTVRGPEMGFDQFARWWVGPPGAETLDA